MELQLAVGIPPGFGLLRAPDLEAIRAAVLYGDQTIVVMHLSTHMTTGLLEGVPDEERAGFLLRSMPSVQVAKAGYPVDDARLRELTRRLARMAKDWTTLHESDAVRLDVVVEDDTYGTFDVDGEPALYVRIDPGIAKFGARLAELLDNPRLHLVLPNTGLRHDPAGRWPRDHSGIGMELISRIPGFAHASLQEVVDIRKELADPLVRFRAAVVELATDAGDESIEETWLSRIAPSLRDLDEAVQENRYLRRLTERLLSSPDGVVSVASTALGVAVLQGIPQVLAAAVGVALPALRAGWDRQLAAEQQAKHRLFFLHQVERRTRGGTS